MSRKLTFVIHALHTGGAERVLARLANHWAAAGDEVTVITLDAVESDALALHPQVGRIGLEAMRLSRTRWQGLWNNLLRIWRLRRAIRRTGTRQVISFTDKMNVLTLLACVGLPVDVVIAERSHPFRQQLSPGWERLRRRMYPRCRAWVVQTAAVAESCGQLVGGKTVHVIPNAAVPPPAPSAAGKTAGTPPPRRVIAVGRLSREKGFDLLIRAFGRIAARQADWTLRILGDGEQRPVLEQLVADLQLADRVALPGWVDESASHLSQADLFVLPSRYEGFPNALLEAMAVGLPVISFACDSGPNEIIRPEVDGLLVPPEDVTALAAAMDRLMTDAAERERLGRRAVEVLTRFDEPTFFQRWEEVLASGYHSV
jgi:GalNAc-alpha-(1->4)-GalNAc-alpha-(1->3)-diNAcBac-PP-undecaprenol alpha-1,4-N-acetyl-D-galactosaminyltransferase